MLGCDRDLYMSSSIHREVNRVYSTRSSSDICKLQLQELILHSRWRMHLTEYCLVRSKEDRVNWVSIHPDSVLT